MKLGFTRAVACGAFALAAVSAASAQQSNVRSCDRQCLTDITEQYFKALVAHDPKREPIHPDARYTENGVDLKLPDGIWRTLSNVRAYRLYVVDPETGMVGVFSTADENGAGIVLSSRLKVRDRRITEIETTVARSENATAAGAGAALAPRPDDLKEVRPAFTQALAANERLPRWRMIQIADSYFRGLENNTGALVPPFADDCHRLENGVPTANASRPPPPDPSTPVSSATLSCRESFALGYYREDTRLRGMRFLAVDEERGLVFVTASSITTRCLRSYPLNNGKTQKVSRTAPWTWMISEVFKIRSGKIWQVEAVLLQVPYGMKSGWDNGVKTLSWQEAVEQERQ